MALSNREKHRRAVERVAQAMSARGGRHALATTKYGHVYVKGRHVGTVPGDPRGSDILSRPLPRGGLDGSPAQTMGKIASCRMAGCPVVTRDGEVYRSGRRIGYVPKPPASFSAAGNLVAYRRAMGLPPGAPVRLSRSPTMTARRPAPRRRKPAARKRTPARNPMGTAAHPVGTLSASWDGGRFPRGARYAARGLVTLPRGSVVRGYKRDWDTSHYGEGAGWLAWISTDGGRTFAKYVGMAKPRVTRSTAPARNPRARKSRKAATKRAPARRRR